ncbi:conserved Plasmodium membrane protein, unknown function [Plasmodium vinckei vinckei]|uniref:Uncharacterized protein n=1 Tax=Plasmodium vinckei vinckei TaxID=54757 RepID=A0A449BPX8_PLAVN|nr:conserved Plasmodium membrane protein, unknown function [Plasmodium vinckei vinckei]VEV55526.1 conserved Plasmodium membrane protein, unknown function [Plasmodium vinckei vinckei]
MLNELLSIKKTPKDGMKMFLHNKCALITTKLSHLIFYFLYNFRNFLNISPRSAIIIFLISYIIILYFFFMCWHSCYEYIKKIIHEDLMDGELDPSILNEIAPQIFFSICSLLLITFLYIGHLLAYLNLKNEDPISIPVSTLIIFFIVLMVCILYGVLFKYNNSASMLLIGINGIATLIFVIYKNQDIYFPSLICSGYYLYYHVKKLNKIKYIYYNREEKYLKFRLWAYTIIFISTVFVNFNCIGTELFSFLLLVAFGIYFYSDFCLHKVELTYEPIDSRLLQAQASSFYANNETLGPIN